MGIIKMGGGTPFYGKTEAQMVAGIAILLMIWHHLFAYPNWLIDGVSASSIFGKYADSLVWLTARLGNICIYIFAFQSGYSLYERFDLYDTLKKRYDRIISFLISYWMVCISFWIFGMMFKENMPTFKNALLNLVGLEVGFFSDWINVTFAWYVLYYILLIASFPILNRCFRSNKPIVIVTTLIGCVSFLVILSGCGIREYWNPFMASIAGIMTAKFRIFEWLSSNMKQNAKGWSCFVALICVMLMRTILLYIRKGCHENPFFVVFESICEGLIAFAFIFAFLSLMKQLNNRKLSYVFCFMGGISMFLWFLHSILFSGSRFLQSYIYFTKEPIVIYVMALALFIPFSILFSKAFKGVKKRMIS